MNSSNESCDRISRGPTYQAGLALCTADAHLKLSKSQVGYKVGRCVEIGIPMLILFIAFSQYLKNFQTRQMPILERFSLLICITVIWAYAHLLTASGAYKHCSDVTQLHCRTDKANLISSAPFYEIQDHPLTLKIAAIRIKIPYPLQWGAPTFAAGQ
ncbi:hypothetical protein LWI28_026907 [Acer negundo]|uniref:Uncharacterized protein n=1 Tax=Acer negundo TaxID=4023 RepID=A0AAD5JHB8_ACENE|nr:hypothetical protein LWI28_026907 [Acer negundo]